MIDPELHIRPIRPDDLDACMHLKERAGWNQERRDWEIFLACNPSGCMVACIGKQVVGTITSIDYQHRFSWIGMVLVHPDFRRRGIGTALLQAALDALADCETVKLDATPAGKKLYDGLGFVDERLLARWVASEEKGNGVPGEVDASTDGAVAPMHARDLDEVAALDAPIFGADRSGLLRAWFERTPQAAFVHRRNMCLSGFVMGRPGTNFATIGPLIATDEAVARALLCRARQAFAGQPLCMDIVDHSPTFKTWLKQQGFMPQRPFIRMARGPNRYPGQPELQWSILGPEVG